MGLIFAGKLLIILQGYCDRSCPYTEKQRDIMCNACFLGVAKDEIERMPTVEAEPIRHGHWILDKRGNYACEFCGNTPYHSNMYNMNYCPNCGAKLTIERDNISTHLIWNEQTVDAVEVVRCKDCKWHDYDFCANFNVLGFKGDDYCSMGQRREDETD